MSIDNLLLYGIGAILFLAAIAASFFMFSEVIELVRDVVRNRFGPSDDYDEGGSSSGRRIVPFRDRGTVERLIAYFTRHDRR